MSNKAQHILFILDRSGSMSSRATDVIGGFNTYIAEMKAEADIDGLSTIVSLVTFADNHSVVFASKPVAEVEPLSAQTYRAAGSTALLDAVFDTVTRYREKIGQGAFSNGVQEDAPPILVFVFTDGEENASTQATWEQVQDLIHQTEALGNWTFTYIGAHASTWSQSSRLSVKPGNVLDASDMCVREIASFMAVTSKRHRADYRDHDKKSSDTLFTDEQAAASTEEAARSAKP